MNAMPIMRNNLCAKAEMDCQPCTLHNCVSFQSPGRFSSEVALIVIFYWHRLHDILARDQYEVDADAVVVIIPQIVLVSVQLVFLQVLEEGVMRLSTYDPRVPTWPGQLVFHN